MLSAPKARATLALAFAAGFTVALPLLLRAHGGPSALWITVVAALLGAVVAGTPATRGPVWAMLLARLGRLVGAGLLAGGALAATMGAVGEWSSLSALGVAPSNLTARRVARAAVEAGAAGAMWGVVLGVVVLFVALPEVVWARRRAREISPFVDGSRLGSMAVVAPLAGFVAACEGLLRNDDIITWCSSACTAYPLTPGTRAAAVLIALTAFLGARSLGAAGAGARRAAGAWALVVAGVAALFFGYTTYSTDTQRGFHRGWLFVRWGDIPGDGALRDARVASKHDVFGRALEVRLASGEVIRWRLSLGPFAVRDEGELVGRVDAETKEP